MPCFIGFRVGRVYRRSGEALIYMRDDGHDETLSVWGFLAWVLGWPMRALRAWRQAIKESKDTDVDPW